MPKHSAKVVNGGKELLITTVSSHGHNTRYKKPRITTKRIQLHKERNTSEKAALLVGINYTGTSSQLNGCINDVNHMRKLLEARGYSVKVLTEAAATRENILSSLVSLVTSGAKKMVFHYSGHGSFEKNSNGDHEEDNRDESLVSFDYNNVPAIVDDEIRDIIDLVPEKSSLFCLFDCCHSGTVCDLPYNYYVQGEMPKLVISKQPETSGEVYVLSGCRDAQTSADAYIDNLSQGALTYSFLYAMSLNLETSFSNLLLKVHEVLKKRQFTQTACLSAGKSADVSLKFKL